MHIDAGNIAVTGTIQDMVSFSDCQLSAEDTDLFQRLGQTRGGSAWCFERTYG